MKILQTEFFKKIPFKTISFSAVNAFVMLVLSLYWLSLPRTFGDEAFFVKWTNLVKKAFITPKKKINPESVLYVDIANSKEISETIDPFYEEKTGYYTTAITNRSDLATFLSYIKKYGSDIPILILDLDFEQPSPNDSLLQAAIDSFPFPIVGGERLYKRLPNNENAIRLRTGIASYQSTNDLFLKYPLFLQNDRPSLPLVAMSLVNHATYKKGWLLPHINQKISLANPIIDFKINPNNLNNGTSADKNTFSVRPLATILYEWEEIWDEDFIKSMLSHTTIIVGNFQTDIHNTVFGRCPGPLIIHNAYLTLLEGSSLIKGSWLLFIFTLFFWMSWRIYQQEKKGIRSKWWHKSKTAVGKILADGIDDSLFLIIGTILSYFLFNIHINILVLFIYLKIVTFILKRFVFRRDKTTQNEALQT